MRGRNLLVVETVYSSAMTRNVFAAVAVLLVGFSWSLEAQTAPVLQTRPDAPLPAAGAIKVTPRMVTLTVTVRGRKG